MTTIITLQGDYTPLSPTPLTSSMTGEEKTKTLAANKLMELCAGLEMGSLHFPRAQILSLIANLTQPVGGPQVPKAGLPRMSCFVPQSYRDG